MLDKSSSLDSRIAADPDPVVIQFEPGALIVPADHKQRWHRRDSEAVGPMRIVAGESAAAGVSSPASECLLGGAYTANG